WLWRLRGRYRRHAFLSGCLPLLAAGGVGGTLYHAFRRSYFLYMLDVVPITLLAVAVSLYLWIKLARRWWYLLPVLPPYLAAGAIPRAEMSHRVINACYVILALLMLLPTLLVLRLNQFRGSGWIVTAILVFFIALGFRVMDVAWRIEWLPMGT